MPTSQDLLALTIDRKPTEFASAFEDLIGQKAIAALEARRDEISGAIYDEEPEDDDSLLDEPDDFDVDLDELDLDLEGLDTDD
jgi:hypothetical protein